MKNEQKNENSVEGNGDHMNDDKHIMPAIIEYVLTQFKLKQGLAKYKKQMEEATKKELLQRKNINAIIRCKQIDSERLKKCH